jgi:predicted transcriptional regulator
MPLLSERFRPRLIVYTTNMQSTTYKSHSSTVIRVVEDTNPDPQFGENVRHYRKEAGLTQETLGELTGLDRGYISGVERGVRNPTLVNIEKIAKALQVKTAQLFE